MTMPADLWYGQKIYYNPPGTTIDSTTPVAVPGFVIPDFGGPSLFYVITGLLQLGPLGTTGTVPSLSWVYDGTPTPVDGRIAMIEYPQSGIATGTNTLITGNIGIRAIAGTTTVFTATPMIAAFSASIDINGFQVFDQTGQPATLTLQAALDASSPAGSQFSIGGYLEVSSQVIT